MRAWKNGIRNSAVPEPQQRTTSPVGSACGGASHVPGSVGDPKLGFGRDRLEFFRDHIEFVIQLIQDLGRDFVFNVHFHVRPSGFERFDFGFRFSDSVRIGLLREFDVFIDRLAVFRYEARHFLLFFGGSAANECHDYENRRNEYHGFSK
jgi:hypothetical protein